MCLACLRLHPRGVDSCYAREIRRQRDTVNALSGWPYARLDHQLKWLHETLELSLRGS